MDILRAFRTAFAIAALAAAAAPVRAATPGDWFLSAPYAAKAALPLLLVPEALTDPDDVLLPVCVLLAGVTFPNSMVLHKVHSGQAGDVALWRGIAFTTEMATAAGVLGWGIYNTAKGSRSDDMMAGYQVLGGMLLILYSVPMIALAQINRIPFAMEKPRGISAALLPLGPGGSPGVMGRLALSF